MNLGIKSKVANILSKSSYGDYFVRSYRRRNINLSLCKNKALKAANYVSYYTNKEYEGDVVNQLKNPVLKHARIETTNICNLNCIGCGTRIRELLYDLHNAAIKKSNSMADEVVQKHFVN